MKTKIHVNQHVIRRNLKTGEREPCLTVKTSKKNTYTSTVEIVDNEGDVIGRFVYRPDKPLSCGARLWFECDSDNVRVVTEETKTNESSDTREPVRG